MAQRQQVKSKFNSKIEETRQKSKKPDADEDFQTANDTDEDTENEEDSETENTKIRNTRIKRNTEIESSLLFGKTKEDWTKDSGQFTMKFIRITEAKRSKIFVNNIINREYPHNYDIQEDHLKLLVDTIKLSHHLFAPITLIQYTAEPDNIFMLIDAHHRIRALKQIFEDDPDFKIQLEIYIYLSDTIESETTQTIFNICNRVKISSKDEMKIKLCSEVSRELKRLYGSIIKTKTENDTNRANRPNFHVNRLNKGIELLLKRNPEIKCNEIIEGIVKYNRKISNYTIEELIGKSQKEPKDLVAHETAHKKTFYLGLHPSHLSHMWRTQFKFDE
jgi:hypothetical protein